MCLRLILLVVMLWLAGCQAQNVNSTKMATVPKSPVLDVKQITDNPSPCRYIQDETLRERFDCDPDYLLQLHAMAMQTPWALRKAGLPTTAINDVATTLFAAIMVLPADTPYQPRLRAQQQAASLPALLSPTTADWLQYMVALPNQRLLQLESETVMQRRDARNMQEKLQALQHQVGEQERQIQALLQIEASLLHKEGGGL